MTHVFENLLTFTASGFATPQRETLEDKSATCETTIDNIYRKPIDKNKTIVIKLSAATCRAGLKPLCLYCIRTFGINTYLGF